MDSSRTSSSNQQVPCRFFAQGTCWNGKFCSFSHDLSFSSTPSSFTPTPTLQTTCRFFGTAVGCRNGQKCPFIHSHQQEKTQPPPYPALLPHTAPSKQPKPPKIDEQAPICDCASLQIHSTYEFHTKRRGQKKSKKLQLLCTMSLDLGQCLFQYFPLLEASWDPSQTEWWFTNAQNNSSLQLSLQSDAYFLKGDPYHSFCIYYWLESLLGLFQVSVERQKGKSIQNYSDYLPGSLYVTPLPLTQRFQELFELTEYHKAQSKRRSPAKPKASPLQMPQLDQDEKLAILDYANRIQEESDSEFDNDSFISEESEQLESDSDSETSAESLGDVSIFDGFPDIDIAERNQDKGYTLRHIAGFEEEFSTWLANAPNHIVSLSHLFVSQGGFHVLTLNSESERMMDVNSAGCGRACQLSESVSFDVLYSCHPELTFSCGEMEMDYWRANSPKIDYLCEFRGNKIAVSVTRAWNGPHTSFTNKNARRLLLKKLRGLSNAHKFVSASHSWSQQILHVWCPSETVCVLLQNELDLIMKENILQIEQTPHPTLILFSCTQFQIPSSASFLFRCD